MVLYRFTAQLSKLSMRREDLKKSMRREHTVHKLFGLLLRSVVISLYKLKMPVSLERRIVGMAELTSWIRKQSPTEYQLATDGFSTSNPKFRIRPAPIQGLPDSVSNRLHLPRSI
jgi:hypothetical protein